MNRAALLSSTTIPDWTNMAPKVTRYAELRMGNRLLQVAPIADNGNIYFSDVPVGSKLTIIYPPEA
jgi:hypothetical protein